MTRHDAPVLITGGAGFVGTNLAHRLLSSGVRVRVLDSLVRPGSRGNLEWLRERHAGRVEIVRADVRDAATVRVAMLDVQHVYHLAAQVAVTASVASPAADFAVNAAGTLAVLEAARSMAQAPSLIYTSTNKVYGALPEIALRTLPRRYEPVDEHMLSTGISERQALDFNSPYGCSKGCADQYVLDYARSFGMRTVVFRMSCIYGPHQNGTEDQGWVAHLMRELHEGRGLTVYGTGFQVRDLLFVEDLVDAFEHARARIDTLSGRAFNIGGGPRNAFSVLEVIDRLEEFLGHDAEVEFGDWRPGDQRYYVSDIGAFARETAWQPRVEISRGLERLLDWMTPPKAERGVLEIGGH